MVDYDILWLNEKVEEFCRKNNIDFDGYTVVRKDEIDVFVKTTNDYSAIVDLIKEQSQKE